VRDGLADHWREMLRLLTGQVNQSGGVGGFSRDRGRDTADAVPPARTRTSAH
jgi:hypothetical protein